MDERPSQGRYRGRRRAPTPPRNRYATVVTTAVVGAGVVAFGASMGIPDAKVDAGQLSGLANLDTAALDERAEAAERVSRASRMNGGLATSINQTAPDVWLLPVYNYSVTSGYGWRWGALHAGVDLAVPAGTPVYAAHAGKVALARWYAGYGYAVIIDHGDGIETVYGHNSELLVAEGQEVAAGDRISLAGNTGYSFGDHVHFEVHIDGVAQDPVPWMQERGVDIISEVEEIYANSTGS